MDYTGQQAKRLKLSPGFDQSLNTTDDVCFNSVCFTNPNEEWKFQTDGAGDNLILTKNSTPHLTVGDEVVIGDSPDDYKLPLTRATESQSALIDLNGDGNVSWGDITPYNLARPDALAVPSITVYTQLLTVPQLEAYPIPANTLVAGSTYRFKSSGLLTNTNIADTIGFRLFAYNFGNPIEIVSDIGQQTLPVYAPNVLYSSDIVVTFQTVGVDPVVSYTETLAFGLNPHDEYVGTSTTRTLTNLTTASDLFWFPTVAWGSVDVGRLLTQYQYTIEKLV
jgi:hypothetical protein